MIPEELNSFQESNTAQPQANGLSGAPSWLLNLPDAVVTNLDGQVNTIHLEFCDDCGVWLTSCQCDLGDHDRSTDRLVYSLAAGLDLELINRALAVINARTVETKVPPASPTLKEIAGPEALVEVKSPVALTTDETAAQSLDQSAQTPPKPQPDLAEIQKFFDLLIEPGRVIELRAPKTKAYGTRSGYYLNSQALVQATFDVSADEGNPGTYWSLQRINPSRFDEVEANTCRSFVETGGTTSDEQIVGYCYLPIDFDPKRKANCSSTDQEKAAALELASKVRGYLLDRGITSVLADSGNGYHALVKVELDVTKKDLIQSLLKGLSRKFSTKETPIDKKNFNPSRILKAYGTVARKGTHTAERPWRTARILDAEDIKLTLEELLRELDSDLKSEKSSASSSAASSETATTAHSQAKAGDFDDSLQLYQRVLNGEQVQRGGEGGYDNTIQSLCGYCRGTLRMEKWESIRDFILPYKHLFDQPNDFEGVVERQARNICKNKPVGKKYECLFTGKESGQDAAEKAALLAERLALPAIVQPIRTTEEIPLKKVDSNDWVPTSDLRGKPGDEFFINHGQTDVGKLVLLQRGESIIYVTIGDTGSWMRFNNKVWVPVGKSQIRELVRKASEFILNETIPRVKGKPEYVEKRRKVLRSLVSNCHEISFTTSVMEWMQEHQLAFSKFDQKDNLVNFTNKTWDFATDTFKSFDPSDLSTQMMACDYREDATCPTFLKMLNNAFEPEMVSFVIRYMGYCMLGTAGEKKFVLFHGGTDTGKTDFIETLVAVMGDYALHFEWEALSLNRAGSIRCDLAAFINKRFGVCDEGDNQTEISAAILKLLTGGGMITARFMRENNQTFMAKAKLILSSNFRPILDVTDDAVWNRVLDVHMHRSFKRGNPNRIENLRTKLWEEREGIVALMVEGARDFRKNGLVVPKEIELNNLDYQQDLDPVKQFLAECCLTVEGAGDIAKADLHGAFDRWAKENEREPIPIRVFSPHIKDLGFAETKYLGTRKWRGISLKPEQPAGAAHQAVNFNQEAA